MTPKLRRIWARLRPTSPKPPEVDAAVPLVHLLTEADPAPDMFARIEAQIDTMERPAAPLRRRMIVAAFVSGVCIGAMALWSVQSRQHIVARSHPSVDWVPLGAVTLHGVGLRAFVRAKCHGHTHFLITMHGQTIDSRPNSPVPEIPLMDANEKILMECIF